MADATKNDRADRRSDIARTALSVFLAKGYGSASMTAIAREVGIEKASLYHHFSGKEDLFLHALAVDFAEPMDRIAVMAADQDRRPMDLLAEALGVLHDVMLHSPIGRLVTVISETARTQPTVARGFHENFIVRFEEALAAAAAPARAQGYLRDLDSDELNMLVFAPLLEMAITAAIFDAHPDIKARYIQDGSRARYVRMAIGAIAVPGAPGHGGADGDER